MDPNQIKIIIADLLIEINLLRDYAKQLEQEKAALLAQLESLTKDAKE